MSCWRTFSMGGQAARQRAPPSASLRKSGARPPGSRLTSHRPKRSCASQCRAPSRKARLASARCKAKRSAFVVPAHFQPSSAEFFDAPFLVSFPLYSRRETAMRNKTVEQSLFWCLPRELLGAAAPILRLQRWGRRRCLRRLLLPTSSPRLLARWLHPDRRQPLWRGLRYDIYGSGAHPRSPRLTVNCAERKPTRS